jgi:hypothetical protein
MNHLWLLGNRTTLLMRGEVVSSKQRSIPRDILSAVRLVHDQEQQGKLCWPAGAFIIDP